MARQKDTPGRQQGFANGKKRPRSESADADSSSDDVPLKNKHLNKKQKPEKERADSLLQKYKDDSLAACKLQEKYPEAYEQVKAYVLKATLDSSGNKLTTNSAQLPYIQLKRMLKRNVLEIPASLAEAVRVMCPNHNFTSELTAQMVSLGWDPALICHPTKSAKQRLAASKEEQMEKHGVDLATVDMCEDALSLQKRLAGVGKHGKLDDYMDPDLELMQQTQAYSTTQHMTKLQDQLTDMRREMTDVNTRMFEIQRQSTKAHQNQMTEVQSQLTEITSKFAEIPCQLIDTFKGQIEEMQRQLVTTHQSQSAELQRQLTKTHQDQVVEMHRQVLQSQQSQMGDIQRQLARLNPSGPPVSSTMTTNEPVGSFSGPSSNAYYQHYQLMAHGLPSYRPDYGC